MKEDLTTLSLAKELIECPSITPQDHGCQFILAHRLERLGFTIRSLPFKDVENLWAIHGHKPPLLVFAGHTDVVPPGNPADWETPPFTPHLKDGFLYGRGAADMKGSIAAMITACERFMTQYPEYPGSIAFLITSDEEGHAENGTVKVLETLKTEGIKIEYCLVGEPSSRKVLGDVLKIGRRGSLNCTLTIFGKQGHVAYPEKANNPIHQAFLPLAELTAIKWDQGNDFFPATSMQISNIAAGTGANNVIPGSLHCHINFRFNTETTPEQLISRLKSVLDTYQIQYDLIWTVSGMPFLTPKGLLISSCIQAIQEMTEITPTLTTDGGTSDGRFFAPLGTEIVELGPCNATIHCVNESVKIDDLNKLSLIYERILELMFT